MKECFIQYQAKVWTHLLIKGFFLICTIFYIVEVVTKVVLSQSKLYFIFEILQIATLCTLLAFSQPAS